MKERVHEALLIRRLVSIYRYHSLGTRLLRLTAEGHLLHGSDLLLLKIYGRHLGRGVLGQTRPLVRVVVVELGVAAVFLLGAAPIPVLALLLLGALLLAVWAAACLRVGHSPMVLPPPLRGAHRSRRQLFLTLVNHLQMLPLRLILFFLVALVLEVPPRHHTRHTTRRVRVVLCVLVLGRIAKMMALTLD